MPLRAMFGISVILSFISWGIIAKRYIWPALRRVPRTEALRPLLLLHTFRFVGLAFLIPGVVSPDLPIAFARPAAYGDLTTSIFALLAIAPLGSSLGIVLVWHSTFSGAQICYTHSTKVTGSPLTRHQGCREPPTLFRPSWYRCC